MTGNAPKKKKKEEEEEKLREFAREKRIWKSDGCAELMGRPSQTGPILSPLIFLLDSVCLLENYRRR